MRFLHVFTCTLSILPFGLSEKNVNTNPNKPSVGRFQINLHDDRLLLQDAKANQTLVQDLINLFFDNLDFYLSYDDSQIPSVENQSQYLNSSAKANLTNEEFDKYSQVLLNASTDLAKEPINMDGLPNPDVVGFYLEAIYNMTYQTFYYVHGA